MVLKPKVRDATMNRYVFVGMIVAGTVTGERYRRGGRRTPQARHSSWSAADAHIELHGIVEKYVAAITREWLLKLPDSNPAILEMFADRDNRPPRKLLPWSGEFAGKYLTSAVLTLRLTRDPAKECIARFVRDWWRFKPRTATLARSPWTIGWRVSKANWDAWGHYHIMLGLLLWHEDTGDPQALRAASRIGDLLCRKFLRTGKRIVDSGGVEMNHAVIHSLGLLSTRYAEQGVSRSGMPDHQ